MRLYMATKTKVWTYDDYYKLDDEKRYEVIEGELIEMSAPRIIHQRISMNLSVELVLYLRKHKIGEVFASPCDVVLSAVNTFQPDLLFISQENLKIIQEKNISGTPDLVIEILSPSNKDHDRIKKFNLYERFRVKECWIIDSDEKTIKVYVLEAGKLVSFCDTSETQKVKSQIFAEIDLSFNDLV